MKERNRRVRRAQYLVSEFVGLHEEFVLALLVDDAPVLLLQVLEDRRVDVLHHLVQVRHRVAVDLAENDIVVVLLVQVHDLLLLLGRVVAQEPDCLVQDLLLVTVGQEERGSLVLDVVLVLRFLLLVVHENLVRALPQQECLQHLRVLGLLQAFLCE